MVMGVLILFGSVFPYIAVAGPSYSTSEKMGASIMPATAFALCLDRIAGLESSAQGASNANLATVVNNYSLSQGFGMLILMIFVFLFLTWYLDNVLPSEFGVPRVPWFPFTASALSFVCSCHFHSIVTSPRVFVEYWKEVCPCRRKGSNAVHVRTCAHPLPSQCFCRRVRCYFRIESRQSRPALATCLTAQLWKARTSCGTP
jgi:hypothetical protein